MTDERTRKWDRRMIELASVVASWSKDPSTKTGAVICRPDLTIASTGFNGFPRGMDDDPGLYATRVVKLSMILHCEANALLFLREPATGYTLYTVPFLPCGRCALHVIQAGIKRVVAPKPTPAQELRWDFNYSREYFKQTGVEVMEL